MRVELAGSSLHFLDGRQGQCTLVKQQWDRFKNVWQQEQHALHDVWPQDGPNVVGAALESYVSGSSKRILLAHSCASNPAYQQDNSFSQGLGLPGQVAERSTRSIFDQTGTTPTPAQTGLNRPGRR